MGTETNTAVTKVTASSELSGSIGGRTEPLVGLLEPAKLLSRFNSILQGARQEALQASAGVGPIYVSSSGQNFAVTWRDLTSKSDQHVYRFNFDRQGNFQSFLQDGRQTPQLTIKKAEEIFENSVAPSLYPEKRFPVDGQAYERLARVLGRYCMKEMESGCGHAKVTITMDKQGTISISGKSAIIEAADKSRRVVGSEEFLFSIDKDGRLLTATGAAITPSGKETFRLGNLYVLTKIGAVEKAFKNYPPE